MSYWAAIGAAASAAGQQLLGGINSRRAWSRAKQAAKNAHQWEVQDLQAAGLNPILSANGGASAQTFMAQTPAIDFNQAELARAQSAKAEADIANQTKVADAQVSSLMTQSAKNLNDIQNANLLTYNTLEKTKSDIALQATQGNLNAAHAGLASANQGLVRGKTAQLPIMNALYRAQKGAAEASAVASIANARQSNSLALGNEMTNRFYQENPNAIATRETAKYLGKGMGNLYNLGNQIDNIFGGTQGNSGKYPDVTGIKYGQPTD